MRFLSKLGFALVLLGFLAFGIMGLIFAGEMLRRHPSTFLAFWTFIPIVSWWLTWGRVGSPISPRGYFTLKLLKTFTSFLVASSFVLSFLLFLNRQSVRDSVGRHYVEGYLASNGVAYADHWYAEDAMRVFEMALVSGILGFPFLTMFLTRRTLESAEEENIRAAEEETLKQKPKILLSISQGAEDLAPTLALLLQRDGYSPVAVSGISQVKKQLRTARYDLVILDLCDSDFDLRPDELLGLHPLILFLVCDEDMHQGRVPCGYLAVVKTPVEPGEFSRKVREMLAEPVWGFTISE